MLDQVFVTKSRMSQAFTKQGKRVAVTVCKAFPMQVISDLKANNSDKFEIGYQPKKITNVKKPLRTKLKKSGFLDGVRLVKAIGVSGDVAPGQSFFASDLLSVGDVINVQGTSKGRGFAGGIKRHGFHGGPKTHGQSDRSRAVGSIGSGTTPGRVWKGKKMPGRFGNDTLTIKGLVVLHVDQENHEVWLSGPVPGANNSVLLVSKANRTKEVELDKKASGIAEEVVISTEVEKSMQGGEQENGQIEPEAQNEDVKEENAQ